MTFYATTTVAILRTTTTDSYGDVADDNGAAVATGIRAALVEQSTTDVDRATGGKRQLRRYTGRVASNVDIRNGDRIRDERTGVVYAIDSFSTPTTFSRVSSIRLDLDRTT